jgi:hypothetical protein
VRLTNELPQRRVRELCEDFELYADAFEREALFTGPSIFFHQKTIKIRREHGGSVAACVADPNFIDSLYATLASWGMHRMGPGNAKLVDHSAFVGSIRGQQDALLALEHLKVDQFSEADLRGLTERLWHLITSLRIGVGESKIVVGTKAIHHLLPDLVPPIDRRYTVRFFFNQPNAIQGDEAKQQRKFCTMYPQLASIGVSCRDEIQRRPSRAVGMDTSITKIIDNAIVGYVRTELGAKDGENATGEGGL